jgi:hypothetical protein
MSKSLVETLPRFKINLDLKDAVKAYEKTKTTYVEGALYMGRFARTVDVTIDARAQAEGIQRFTYEGKDTYSIPLELDPKDLTALYDLCGRVREEATAQTLGDDDQWQFKDPVRIDGVWYLKVRVKGGEFVPVINGGKVTMGDQGKCEVGDKVKVVGRFSLWMNPKIGEYGIKFEAKTIDF